MENLNAEQIKKQMQDWSNGICENACLKGECLNGIIVACENCMPNTVRNAIALIKSQEERIEELTIDLEAMRGAANSYKMHNKELTQANEQLSESYDHLEKTKDELLAERSRLTEENERLRADCAKGADALIQEIQRNRKLKAELTERKLNDEMYKTASFELKADTVRKMQERVKAVSYQSNDWSHGEHPMVVEVEDIDQIAEEIISDGS